MAIPFDSEGILPSNRFTETWTITAVNGVDNNYFIPDHAPFHPHSVVVFDVDTGAVLQEGTDYAFSHIFEQARDAVGHDIYSGIYLIDPSRVGNFKVSLITIGDIFVNHPNTIVQRGLEALVELQTITWDELVPDDMTFPPTPHTQPKEDVQSVAEIMAAILEATNAIKSGSRDIHLNDIIDLDSTFVQPLLQRLKNIADAILTKATVTSVLHSYVTTGSVTPGGAKVNIGDIPANTWIALPLGIPVPRTGTYVINWGVSPTEGALLTPLANRTRFMVDGGTISKSYDNGAIVQLTEGTIISLNMKLLGNAGADVDLSTTETSSFLSIARYSV